MFRNMSFSLPTLPPNYIYLLLLTTAVPRKYPEAKLQENLDSEIMEVLLQEARDSYAAEMVVELTSNSTDEMESNVDRIESWIKQWKKDNAEREDEGEQGTSEDKGE